MRLIDADALIRQLDGEIGDVEAMLALHPNDAMRELWKSELADLKRFKKMVDWRAEHRPPVAA